MRYVVLLAIAFALAVGFAGNAKSQPGQFADPLAEEVKTLKAAQAALEGRVVTLEGAVAALPFRSDADPIRQTPARQSSVPAAVAPLTYTALSGGYVSVCDGNGCRVVPQASYGQSYYQPQVNYSAFGGGGCPGGNCGAPAQRRGLFGRR